MMDSLENQRLIDSERAKFEREIDRVSGTGERDRFRNVFEMQASSLAMGRRTIREFRGVVGELIRDVHTVVGIQDRAADRKAERANRRAPWATMPTDGSGRVGKAERGLFLSIIVVAVIGIAYGFAASLGLLMDTASGTERPAQTSVTVPAASVSESATESGTGGKFGTPRITLDLNALPSSDCWYEVTMRDVDGMPGGQKIADIQPLCP